jgi:hypothetical protein
MEACGFCNSIQLILSPGKLFETRENQKVTWEYLGSPKKTHTNTHHSQDMTPIHKTIAVFFMGRRQDPLRLDYFWRASIWQL